MEIDNVKLMSFTVGIIGFIFMPLGVIWSLNNIFQVNIEFTLINWLSVAFLQLYLQIIIKASTLNTISKK